MFAAAVAAPSHSYGGYISPVAAVHTTLPLTTYRKEVIPGNTIVSVEPQVQVLEQPYVAKIGEHVHRVPTAVSHQSSTVVHSKADIITPVLAHGVSKHVVPAAPLVKTYHTPSIVKTIAEPAAITYSHAAPLTYGHSYAHSYALPAPYYAGYGYKAYNNYW